MFFHQLMHNWIVLKTILNFAWKLTFTCFDVKNTILREYTIWALLKLQLLKWVKIHWRGSFGDVAAYIVIWSLLVCVCVALVGIRLSSCASVDGKTLITLLYVYLHFLNWISDIQCDLFLNTRKKSALTEQLSWCHLPISLLCSSSTFNNLQSRLFVDIEINVSDFINFIVILLILHEEMVHCFFVLTCCTGAKI
jgi:hypothetical protein